MEGSGTDEKMEESSWTFYIEGFICDNNKDDDDHSFCSSQPESPSLVSDAASSAVKKLADWKENIGGLSKQNSFKKKKTKAAIHVDYDLEDTASSPVNSPKVSYINHFMKEKAKMDVIPEVKRNSFGKAAAVEKDTNYTDQMDKNTTY